MIAEFFRSTYIEAQTSVGISLLAKIGVKAAIEASSGENLKEKPVGQDVNDLKFVADIIINSGRRLVIEDFHYLSIDERKKFSFDLKTLWDYGCFVIIIGVWSQSNLLTYLNADLSGRIVEFSIYWSTDDLRSVIRKGNTSLNIKMSIDLEELLIENCFGNVGILQQLLLLLLDEAAIFEQRDTQITISDKKFFKAAAASYADQLNAIYQQFARTVSAGIRKRKDSTGIYAHAMAVIVSASDDKLINGLELDEIYQIAHNRENRIQKGNLRTVLNKLEELQVDDDGRGLVIAYNDSTDQISAVDRQLLFYRRHLTVNWPWEDLIAEAKDGGSNDSRPQIRREPDGQLYLF